MQTQNNVNTFLCGADDGNTYTYYTKYYNIFGCSKNDFSFILYILYLNNCLTFIKKHFACSTFNKYI